MSHVEPTTNLDHESLTEPAEVVRDMMRRIRSARATDPPEKSTTLVAFYEARRRRQARQPVLTGSEHEGR